MTEEKLTAKDLELIDVALSTTYRDTIYRLIKEAETETCREMLNEILDNPDSYWEV